MAGAYGQGDEVLAPGEGDQGLGETERGASCQGVVALVVVGLQGEGKEAYAQRVLQGPYLGASFLALPQEVGDGEVGGRVVREAALHIPGHGETWLLPRHEPSDHRRALPAVPPP